MLNKRSKTLLYIIGGILCATISGSSTAFADNLGYDVRITPSLLVTIPSDTVSLNLDPFTSAFGTANLPITVSTNNPTGFTLNMSASETDLTLVNGSETIPTLADKTGGYSESEFTANRWGYKLSTATNYSPFALSNELLVTDSPSNASVSTVNFASKVDATKPAGTYELTINFTVVANAVPAPAMQNLNASLCTTDAPTTVRDTRDNEEYLVQRLADGNCWMLDNLRFDIVSHKDDISFTNTNITNSATLTSLKTGNRSAGNNYATAGVSYWTSSYSYSAPLIAIKNASYSSWNPDTVASVKYGSGSGKIGVYYNYCAASAGSYCYGDGTSAGSSSGNASEDICPAGWRMPTGGSGEYQALYVKYNTTQDATNEASLQYNLSTPLVGSFGNGSAGGQGSYGRFWSSTRGSNHSMYFLYVDSSEVEPQYSDSSSGGYSVRCLLQ